MGGPLVEDETMLGWWTVFANRGVWVEAKRK